MGVSQPIDWNGNQRSVFQVSLGTLWHKFRQGGGAWNNEGVAGPSGGRSTIRANFPDQRPNAAFMAGQMVVTVQDDQRRAFYFAQSEGSSDWGAALLP